MSREPRQDQPPTEPREEAKASKGRFQITKLEERIAPCGGWISAPRGYRYRFHYRGPCGSGYGYNR